VGSPEMVERPVATDVEAEVDDAITDQRPSPNGTRRADHLFCARPLIGQSPPLWDTGSDHGVRVSPSDRSNRQERGAMLETCG
jgi:hypothetical protein